nr:hypothetical protein [Tanacetum cinerariifolium]
VNKTMEERLDKHGARLYTLEQLDILQQVSIAVSKVVTDAVDWAMQAPLRNRFRDLPEADMKEILHQRMWETDSYKSHEDHMHLFEALEKSINRDQSEELAHDLAEVRKKRKKGRESPKTPPRSPSHQPHPPPPPAGPSGTSRAPRAFGSQVTPPPPPPTSTNQDSPSTGSAAPSPAKTATTTKHQAWSTPDVTLKLLVSLTPEDLDMDEAMGLDEQAQLSDGEYIGSAYILTIKATYYPDAGLEQMVPDQFWIEEECKYDIAVIIFRTHMRILSVVRIEVFSMYGYVYMKKIVLRRADLNEHVIAERDFKYLYPNDFEDLNLLNLQGHLNHLPPKDKKILTTAVNQWTRQLVIRQHVEDFQLRIESYQTQVNLTKPQWMATCFEYKHDYTVIESPRAVIFRDKYGVQMMMRFNEIHKFNDRTLQQIVEVLDYRVKEFRINRMNPEAFEDTENLPQPGELCWRTRKRGRLQIVEAYRLIKLLQHYQPLSDDLQGWWKPFEEERPTTLEPAWSIRSSDVPVPPNNWASTLASNYSPPPEDSLLAQIGDITTFMDWFCKRRGITELKPQDLEGPAYEIVKRGRPHTKAQHQQTTTTGGPPGQVTIQSHFFFNKDLEYLRYGSKGRRPALSISKMKASYYPDAGLE